MKLEQQENILAWTDVLAEWRAREEEIWRPLYTERGFDSWQAWRESYFKELGLEGREWQTEVLAEPHRVVEEWHVGGFPGWFRYRKAGEDLTTFAQLVEGPEAGELNRRGEAREDVRVNPKVAPMIGHLHETTVVLLRAPGFSTLLEGTHRLAALAVEAADGPRSSFQLRVHVAQFSGAEAALLKEFARDRQAVVKLASDSRSQA